MADDRYNWKRFWTPPEGRVNLSDNGFLVDPDAEYGELLNPDVRSWDKISGIPCLILLGEPGIGKSTALKDEYERTTAATGTSDQALWVDLRSFQTDQRLHERVFESLTVDAWKSGTHRLHLFIDSMDEALIRIDNIGPILLEEFADLPISRLNLRLACRTADWPHDLESEFHRIWGGGRVGLYELAPLRRSDVQVAAETKGLETKEFLAKIFEANATPLAIKPITLRFLLNTFQRYKGFPTTQVELYKRGCLVLCEEPRQQLRPAKPATDLSAALRLAVACRIAAVTILCNRDAVWTEPDLGDVPEADVPLADLTGGTATWEQERIEISEDANWQALDTGLFNSRGPARLGWAHQTYAEFLAAHFLKSRLSHDTIVSLILHQDGKVIPQLHELAAWVATMDPDLFRRLMKTDAEFLLRSDAATADFKDRELLVEQLLALFDKGELFDLDWNQRLRYPKLKHPTLADQLLPYIINKTKGVVVRRVAITIAEACELQSLQPDLVNVSLDTSDIHEIRAAAAFAILRTGDASAKKAMRPLALGTAGLDPDDDLKGSGLACTWPAFLTVTELLVSLTPEKNPHRFGLYRNFLKPEIADTIFEVDLPAALAWAADHGPLDKLDPLTEIADAIAAKATNHLDNQHVLDALGKAVVAWAVRNMGGTPEPQSLFRAALLGDEIRRRRLLKAVLPLVLNSTFEFIHLYAESLITTDDSGWLLRQLIATPDSVEQRAIIALIRRLYDYRQPDQLDALLNACRESEPLAEEFSWLINPVVLGSPDAIAMKSQWEKYNQLNARHEPPLLDPPPVQRIVNLLQKFEEGDLDAFWRLDAVLTLKPNSTHYAAPFYSDITSQPGWQSADEVTKSRIIDAAKTFVANYKLPADSLLNGSFSFSALSGYRALLLLLRIQPDFVRHLLPDVWKRWAPVVIHFPIIDADSLAPVHESLTTLTYERAPKIVIDEIIAVVDKENKDHGMVFVLRRLQKIWDAVLETALVEKLDDQLLKPGAWGTILSELVAHSVPHAIAIAETVLQKPIPPEGSERNYMIQATQALIRNADNAGWDIVWPVIQKNPEFGLEVLGGVAHITELSKPTIGNKLRDTDLAGC